MKNIFFILLLFAFSSLTCGMKKDFSENESFALIELFTSQGCSSCPPADKLLSETLAKANQQGQNILALSFHVDYWNRLGWTDPFSNASFTKRQSDYASKLKLETLYTPQAIVNGQFEFVGSNKTKMTEAIQKSLNSKPQIKFSKLTGLISNNNSVHLNFELNGDIENCTINFALISDKETTSIKRGENSGRTLINENIVRHLITKEASKSGELDIDLEQMQDNFSVIAFVQNKNTFEVKNASKVHFSRTN